MRSIDGSMQFAASERPDSAGRIAVCQTLTGIDKTYRGMKLAIRCLRETQSAPHSERPVAHQRSPALRSARRPSAQGDHRARRPLAARRSDPLSTRRPRRAAWMGWTRRRSPGRTLSWGRCWRSTGASGRRLAPAARPRTRRSTLILRVSELRGGVWLQLTSSRLGRRQLPAALQVCFGTCSSQR